MAFKLTMFNTKNSSSQFCSTHLNKTDSFFILNVLSVVNFRILFNLIANKTNIHNTTVTVVQFLNDFNRGKNSLQSFAMQHVPRRRFYTNGIAKADNRTDLFNNWPFPFIYNTLLYSLCWMYSGVRTNLFDAEVVVPGVMPNRPPVPAVEAAVPSSAAVSPPGDTSCSLADCCCPFTTTCCCRDTALPPVVGLEAVANPILKYHVTKNMY